MSTASRATRIILRVIKKLSLLTAAINVVNNSKDEQRCSLISNNINHHYHHRSKLPHRRVIRSSKIVLMIGVTIVVVAFIYYISFFLGRYEIVATTGDITTANTTTTANTPVQSHHEREQHKVVYHLLRTDRSGSVIYDMLLVHAYTHSLNGTSSYGGACYNDTTTDVAIVNVTSTMIQTHQKYITTLGLNHVLRIIPCTSLSSSIATITPSPTTDTHSERTSTNIRFIHDRRIYSRYGTKRLWTAEWLQYIRSQRRPQQPLPRLSSSESMIERKNVAVHIRRGDVSLCDDNTVDRYIPNSYYSTILRRLTQQQPDTDSILKTNTNTSYIVTIYSESNSTESWSDFDTTSTTTTSGTTTAESSNYDSTLQLDTALTNDDEPPIHIWYAIMNADIVVLSWSTYALIPALFNPHGTIIYTPFWIQIPTVTSSTSSIVFDKWIAIDPDTVRDMKRTKIRLRDQLCHSTMHRTPKETPVTAA